MQQPELLVIAARWPLMSALAVFAGAAVAEPATTADAERKAAAYAIDWRTSDAGGGVSTNGALQVRGTIGQPDAGIASSNGTYAVRGGFWPAKTGEDIFEDSFETL